MINLFLFIVGGVIAFQLTPPLFAMDGVAFERGSLSVNGSCSENVLMATQRFQGTAYLMPRADLAANASGYPIIEVQRPGDDGLYTLTFFLRFYRPTVDVQMRIGQSGIPTQSCNLKELEERLNLDRKRYGVPEGVHINLDTLPIKRVHITLPAFRGQEFLVGDVSTDFIDAQEPHLVQFKFNKKEYEELDLQMKSLTGISLKLNFIYTAQSTDSFLRVHLEKVDIATKVDARLKATIPAGGSVTDAELSGILSDILSENKALVYVEGSEFNAKYIEQIVSDLLKDLSASIKDSSSAPTKPAVSKRREDSARGSILPRFELDVAVAYFRKIRSIALNVQRMNKAQEHNFGFVRNLRSDFFTDPRVVFRQLVSNDPHPVVVVRKTEKDVGFAISPQKTLTERLQYQRKVHYYSKVELNKVAGELSHVFPRLRSGFAEDKHIVDSRYQGQDRAYLPETVLGKFLNPQLATRYTMWGYEDMIPTVASEVFRFSTPSSLYEFPVRGLFSELGNESFALDQLATETENWYGERDPSGMIVIKPKRDLGAFFLLNTTPVQKIEIPVKRHFQEFWAFWSSTPTIEFSSPAEAMREVPSERVLAIVKVILDFPPGHRHHRPQAVSNAMFKDL